MSNPEVTDLEVIDENLLRVPAFNTPPKPASVEVNRSKGSVSYKARGKTFIGREVGSKVLSVAQGSYPDTLTLAHSKSVSNSYSCSLNVTAASVSTAVGFNVSSTTSVTIGGSTKVPYKHNGKVVKYLTYKAYAIYDRYRFTVDKYVSKRGVVWKYKDVGTGIAYLPIGCHYTKTYTYK